MLRTAAMVLVLSASAAEAQVMDPVNGECPANYYMDSDGKCVEHPTPKNDRGKATAICMDGDYSYSQHHAGTCSRHGGVKEWLQR